MKIELTDRVAVVTGASRGIGRAVAEALGRAGATVACVASKKENAEATAAEIRGLLARRVTQPVLWEDSMHALRALGCERFVEPAPGTVLSGLVKKNLEGVVVESFDRVAALEAEGGA